MKVCAKCKKANEDTVLNCSCGSMKFVSPEEEKKEAQKKSRKQQVFLDECSG